MDHFLVFFFLQYPLYHKTTKYRVMEIGVKALEATYGTDYQYGTIAETICKLLILIKIFF